MLINLRKLIHPAKLNIIIIIIWKLNFHGILSKFKTASIDYTNGTIRWKKYSWNSKELGVLQFRWHNNCKQFHGIPWNLACANFTDTRSSMELHGTWNAPIAMTQAVPWNSMEFHGSWSVPISLTRAVAWNSMEPLLSSKFWSCMDFIGDWSMYNTHILWLMMLVNYL